jgi:hypothetical protein
MSDVTQETRHCWLERLWQAIEDDNIPYIEHLGDFWGELCVSEELASIWANKFLTFLTFILKESGSGFFIYKGITPCLSSLFIAKRYHELLSLLEHESLKWWHYQEWGVKTLIAMGKPQQAFAYVKNSSQSNAPNVKIAQLCEEILLSMGKIDEAYTDYAFQAHQKTTYLATFRSIVKKYRSKSPNEILHDLIDSQPGVEINKKIAQCISDTQPNGILIRKMLNLHQN